MEFSQDFLLYQKSGSAVLELERLVVLRSQFIDAYIDVSSIGKAILQRIETLKSAHIVLTKVDCLHDIERLCEIRIKIREGTLSMQDGVDENHHVLESHLQGGGVLDNLIKAKLEALVKVCENESESDRISLLERLAILARKIPDSRIHTVLADAIKILTQSMGSAPYPPIRAVSVSSNDSDDIVDIMTPDDDESTANAENERNNFLSNRIDELRRSLRQARSENAAMAEEITHRDVRIGRLMAQLASIPPPTIDQAGEREVRQAEAQQGKGLAAENARLTEELASAHRTLRRTNSSLCNQRAPLSPPTSHSNTQKHLGGEFMAWPGILPARSAHDPRPDWTNYPPFGLQPDPRVDRSRKIVDIRSGNTIKSSQTHRPYRWTNFDMPTSSAWPVPNAANREPWCERSVSPCNTWD